MPRSALSMLSDLAKAPTPKPTAPLAVIGLALSLLIYRVAAAEPRKPAPLPVTPTQKVSRKPDPQSVPSEQNPPSEQTDKTKTGGDTGAQDPKPAPGGNTAPPEDNKPGSNGNSKNDTKTQNAESPRVEWKPTVGQTVTVWLKKFSAGHTGRFVRADESGIAIRFPTSPQPRVYFCGELSAISDQSGVYVLDPVTKKYHESLRFYKFDTGKKQFVLADSADADVVRTQGREANFPKWLTTVPGFIALDRQGQLLVGLHIADKPNQIAPKVLNVIATAMERIVYDDALGDFQWQPLYKKPALKQMKPSAGGSPSRAPGAGPNPNPPPADEPKADR